jgi:hypothetical protein
VASAKTDMQAAAELAAHEETHGDLGARGQRIRLEEEYLSQQRTKADDRDDVGAIVRLGSDLAAVLVRREQRLQDAYRRWLQTEVLADGRTIEKGAGLADLGFPSGIFDTVDTSVGIKSVWRDHTLLGIAVAYPDIELPPTEAAVVSERAKKTPRWYARSIGWDIYPERRLGS